MTVEDAGPSFREDDAHPGTERVLRFSIPGMDCPSCAGTVERALSALDGVCEHECWPATGTVRITYDPAATDPETIALRSLSHPSRADSRSCASETSTERERAPSATKDERLLTDSIFRPP